MGVLSPPSTTVQCKVKSCGLGVSGYVAKGLVPSCYNFDVSGSLEGLIKWCLLSLVRVSMWLKVTLSLFKFTNMTKINGLVSVFSEKCWKTSKIGKIIKIKQFSNAHNTHNFKNILTKIKPMGLILTRVNFDISKCSYPTKIWGLARSFSQNCWKNTKNRKNHENQAFLTRFSKPQF